MNKECGRCGSKDIKTLPNGWIECQFCGSYNPYPNGNPKPQENKG